MSYYSKYIVFDVEKADQLWSSNLPSESLTDEDLLSEYVSIGSIETYTVLDPYLIEELAVAHSLKFDNYLNRKTLLTLFNVLDRTKISSILEKQNDGLGKTRHMMDLILDYILGISNSDDPLDTIYSLDSMQRYATPLFEEHGIIIYNKVNKSTMVELLEKLDLQKVEKAILRSSFVREASALHQEGILQTLNGLKKIALALQENPQSLLIFEDDYGMYPRDYASELLQKIRGPL